MFSICGVAVLLSFMLLTSASPLGNPGVANTESNGNTSAGHAHGSDFRNLDAAFDGYNVSRKESSTQPVIFTQPKQNVELNRPESSVLKYRPWPDIDNVTVASSEKSEKAQNIRTNPTFIHTEQINFDDFGKERGTDELISKHADGDKRSDETGEAIHRLNFAGELRNDINDANSQPGQQSPATENGHNCSVDIWSEKANQNGARCKVVNTTADFRGCNLTCVPTNLNKSITQLYLANNKISSEALYEGVFQNYKQLVLLELDTNNITYLPDGVFKGLDSLLNLSLYNNHITLNQRLRTSTVFHPLKKTLSTLIINRNTNDVRGEMLMYPDQALSVLKNLSSLRIDGLFNNTFGEGFGLLQKLTNLSLAGYTDGYCNMRVIRNETFQYLTNLQYLNISDCNLDGPLAEADAFAPLTDLRLLDVSSNTYLGLEGVGYFMYGLRFSKLQRLVMHHVVHRFVPCTVIFNDTLRYFRDTTLEVIEAMNNEIEMIEWGALKMLPSTLRTVNLTNNRIMFGAYWQDMQALTGLETLYLDGYLHPVDFPNHFPISKFYCPEPKRKQDFFRSTSAEESDEQWIGGSEACSDKNEFVLPLPPKLTNFSMHGNSLAYSIKNLTFCSNNSLLNVDLSDNMFPHLEGPVLGLNKIKILNLSSCFIETIQASFFDNLTTLEYLNLFQNLLGDCLGSDGNGNVFDKLDSLTYLSLSFNNLYLLTENAFKDLNNLETLDLSTNRLSHINFSTNHMKNLKFIDLHKNDISELRPAFREHISDLLRVHNVTIDMRQNPIHCDCTNLDFLEWVVSTKVFGNNYTLYYCKYPMENENAVEMPDGYEETVAILRKQCATNVGLFLGVVGGTLVLVLVILGMLLYRFRWTLRYWYHAAKLKIYSNPHPVGEDVEFDVFISYASEDVDFVLQVLCPQLKSRNLKLLIHGETFQAGRHITDNIYSAVCQSRKTLVLVTKRMLSSHWCTYELQMARMKSISTGRNVLLFLFLEEIPSSLLTVQVMSYIKTSTYISYPSEVQHREAFWNKLADDLRAP